MTNEQAIKPCPFCGGTNIGLSYHGQPAVSFFYVCSDCGGHPGATGSTNPSGGKMNQAATLAAWNTRAQEAAVQPEPVAPIGEIVGTQKVGFTEIPLVMWFPKPPVLGTKLYAAQPLTPPAGLPLKDQRAIEDMRQFLQMPSEERKAAVRYLWLRDANNWTEDGLVVCSGNGEDTCYGEALDRAIDRAMLSALPKE